MQGGRPVETPDRQAHGGVAAFAVVEAVPLPIPGVALVVRDRFAGGAEQRARSSGFPPGGDASDLVGLRQRHCAHPVGDVVEIAAVAFEHVKKSGAYRK